VTPSARQQEERESQNHIATSRRGLPFNRRYCTFEAMTRRTRSPFANGLTEPAGRSTMLPQRRGPARVN
jgi:hypothetical protein